MPGQRSIHVDALLEQLGRFLELACLLGGGAVGEIERGIEQLFVAVLGVGLRLFEAASASSWRFAWLSARASP